jgi:putative radical SAM enzyme (TIGR03279 family)
VVNDDAAICAGVVVAVAGEAAERGGLRAGDRIVELNGVVPLDVLDVEDAAADGTLWLKVLRDGHPLDLVVAPEPGEWHGISLDHDGLGDEARVCRNRCKFCFVDQVPRGLRPGLSVKDDDYRLSFLHGNFMTLTNLSEGDLARIEELRLSPLFVSLHAWDDAARVRLMGRAAAGSRAVLERLAEAGLELHLQVVLCPGWNDGDVLAETVARTGALEAVVDLGIVPVSLAAEGDLRRVGRTDARAVLDAVAAWQREFEARRGSAFVHAADEFYLLAGADPPAGDAPEQYENGVGICAALLEEAGELAAAWSGGPRRGAEAAEDAPPRPGRHVTGVRLLTGAVARPVVERAATTVAAAAGVPTRAFAVQNALFGPHVTVTGLLGGAEVLEALRCEPLAEGEWLLAPRVWLPAGLGRTLDDVSGDELAAACGGRLIVAGSLGDAFARLSE